MNPRISVALLSAAMLAGCGFSDSSNYAGGAFLAAQGESVQSRANASLSASTKSVEYLPTEGYPALPGNGYLAIGTLGSDSIRTVIGFDLRDLSVWGGPDSLRKRPFRALTFTVTDAAWAPQLRVRWVLADTAGTSVPAVFMGAEPDQLGGLLVLSDTLVAPKADSNGLFSLAMASEVSDSVIAAAKPKRGWLMVILDPVVASGTQTSVVRFVQQAGILIDATRTLAVGAWAGLLATRSVHLRSAQANRQELGWWAGSGSRPRLELDGDAIRASLHRQVAADVTTPETDNSYHVLSARASLGFQKFTSNISSARMLITAHVIEREDSARLVLGSKLAMPASILTESEAGSSVAVRCTTIVEDVLADCSVLTDGQAQVNSTRATYGNANFSAAQDHFWLRLDVADQAEFPVLNNLRVSIRSENSDHGSSQVWVKWIRIHSKASPDYQSDSAGIRSQAKLSSGSSRVELEIRSALSQVILQKKRKVVLDLAPAGVTYSLSGAGLDLWSAQPKSPSQWIDSIRVLVRPRDGGNI